MKWLLTLGFLLSAAHSSLAAKGCTTAYASTPITKVPTSRTTTTITNTVLSYTYALFTDTTTIVSTYVSVVGDTTTIVPTGTSFTPIISAPTLVYTRSTPSGGFMPFARAVSATASTLTTKPAPPKYPTRSSVSSHSPSPTKFPHSVKCTVTSTLTHTTYSTSSVTTTQTSYSPVTSTSHVATSTAYAACDTPDNVQPLWHGLKVSDEFGGSGASASCGPVVDRPDLASCLNARTCCEYAQSRNASGFLYNDYQNEALCLYVNSGAWYFDTLDQGTLYPYTIGNGVSGSGTYFNLVGGS